MCLLIYKPKDVEIPYEYLLNAEESNPNGSGIAVADGKDIHIFKDPTWKAYELAAKLDTWKGHPALVHFRFSTHGSDTVANTHPMMLPKKWAAAHNGIISNIECKEDESDTNAFLRKRIKPIVRRGMCLTNKRVVEAISSTIGAHNKMAFLHADGRYSIANEESGHWHKGIWFSNTGYKSWPVSYKRKYTPSRLLEYNLHELDCKMCGAIVQDIFYVDRDDGSITCETCETLAGYY